jgi:small subunit ribosomal protein S21
VLFRFIGHEGIHPRQKIKPLLQREENMKVVVQDNQIEKAIRDLKKKLTKEGFFSEIKERRFYDKPSVQKKKKMAKAAKRRRKRMRKFN